MGEENGSQPRETSRETQREALGGQSDAARPWTAFATPLIGKAVRGASRLLRHGGSAFPGKIVEQIDPGFLARTLADLPYGVVLVSGTNGKTTTTRMVASMLETLGLKVFTNPTGSNFTRGVVSALLIEVPLSGRLDADVAVLELDEAYAVKFVQQVKPRFALLLNVMRDQLDRFGEIDNTARLLERVAEATTGTVVLNREDPRIARFASAVPEGTGVRYFGLAPELRRFFPSDDDMQTTVAEEAASVAGNGGPSANDRAQQEPAGTSVSAEAPDADGREATADVTLTRVGNHEADFLIDGRAVHTAVKLEGVYNLFNAAAALATVRAVMAQDIASAQVAETVHAETMPGQASHASDAAISDESPVDSPVDHDRLLAALAEVTPAFGRGETIAVNGSDVQLLLVKNPMGFRLSLGSFPPDGHDTMIAICDLYADGRDMSWLWDVDFTSLRPTGVAMVSGTRAWDMALRLEYDQVRVEQTGTDLEAAVRQFVTARPGVPKHIYCTYTSMLRVRAELAKLTTVADAGVGR